MKNTSKEIRYQLNSLPKLFIDKKNSSEIIEITVTVGNGVYEEISVSANGVNLDCTMGWNEGSFEFKIPANNLYELLNKKPFDEITSEDLMIYDWELIETSNGNLTYNKVNNIEIEKEDEIINSLKGTIFEIDEEEIEQGNKYDLITDQMYALYNRGDIDDSEYRFNTLFSLEFKNEKFGNFFIDWNFNKENLEFATKSFNEKNYQDYLNLILEYLKFEFNVTENIDLLLELETAEFSDEDNEIIKNISISYEHLGKYDEALKYIGYYINKNPNISLGYEKKAEYLIKLERKEEAIQILKLVIDLIPNKITPIIECSGLLKELGKESEAIDLLKFGINKNPESFLLYSVLGHLYYDKKDWVNAKEYYEKSIEINNDSSVTNRQLGMVYYNLKNYELAANKLKHSQLLDNDYKDTYTYYFIGESYKNLGQFQDAIDQYLNCINLEVDNVHVYAYGSMGFCYLKINDFENCIKHSSKGLKETFNLQNVGKAYFGIKNYSQALEKFNEVIEVNANYKWAYHWKGDSLFELQKYSEALESYNKLLELDPNYTTYKDCTHIAERITFINSINKF